MVHWIQVNEAQKGGRTIDTLIAYQGFRAIQRQIRNVTFRSGTEARWSLMFDYLGMKWSYEPRRVRLQGLRTQIDYIPDFYLHGTGQWLEVKGSAGQIGEYEQMKFDLFSYFMPTVTEADRLAIDGSRIYTADRILWVIGNPWGRSESARFVGPDYLIQDAAGVRYALAICPLCKTAEIREYISGSVVCKQCGKRSVGGFSDGKLSSQYNELRRLRWRNVTR